MRCHYSYILRFLCLLLFLFFFVFFFFYICITVSWNFIIIYFPPLNHLYTEKFFSYCEKLFSLIDFVHFVHFVSNIYIKKKKKYTISSFPSFCNSFLSNFFFLATNPREFSRINDVILDILYYFIVILYGSTDNRTSICPFYIFFFSLFQFVDILITQYFSHKKPSRVSSSSSFSIKSNKK